MISIPGKPGAPSPNSDGIARIDLVADIGIARDRMLRPSVMAPPVQWIMSTGSDGFTGRRLVAGHWDTRLAPGAAAARIARSIAWPELTGDVIWAD